MGPHPGFDPRAQSRARLGAGGHRLGGGGGEAPLTGPELARRLRLIVITDRELARPRAVAEVVREALEAGAPAVQLRDKEAGAGELLRAARELRALTREHDALLFVNDRLDVALAAGADGVHVGAGDLPVASVRGAAPAGFLIGCSTDDPERAVAAERDGASYIGCGAVYGTSSKDVGGEVIGTARLAEVARAVSIPVVAIGGVTVARAAEVAASGAAGSAVIGAVMGAEDVGSAVRALMAPFRVRDGRPEDTSERRSDR